MARHHLTLAGAILSDFEMNAEVALHEVSGASGAVGVVREESLPEGRAQNYDRRLLALNFGYGQATKFVARLSSLDNRVSLARLLLCLVYLGLLAAFFSAWSHAYKVLGILSFFVFFAFLSQLHERLAARLRQWKALLKTYEVSLAREERNYKKLITLQSPWHASIAAKVPAHHPYAVDLDVSNQLFLLMDGCTSEESSDLLFKRLHDCALPNAFVGDVPNALGPVPEAVGPQGGQSSGEAVVLNASQCKILPQELKLLARASSVWRRVEALRFNETNLQRFYEDQGQNASAGFAQIQLQYKNAAPFAVRAVFAVVLLLAWVYFLLPAWFAFFQSSLFDPLFKGLLRYGTLAVLGLWVFSPVLGAAKTLMRKGLLLNEINRAKLLMARSLGEDSQERALNNSLGGLRLAVSILDFRSNPLIWLLVHLLFPFDAVACILMELRARKILPRIAEIWEAALQFDYKLQLARFAWENPEFHFAQDPTPQFGVEKAFFVAKDMGHPLLQRRKRVTNSLQLTEIHPAVLLTGSNMAGKSTFLRTLGVNIVLQQLGAPVCARHLHTSISAVMCAIRVEDSLEEASSYFYAEVNRLAQMLSTLQIGSQANAYQCLYLVDEIFRGTNNRERFVGSWFVVKELLETQSFGVVSTHDLSLCNLAQKDARLLNMHFREEIVAGKLKFDYCLRPGPCPTTNALHIMRAAGLPVPENAETQV